MKTLYFLRHAKSSWKDSRLEDQERPLKKKGHFQADLVSDHLSSLLPPPQNVLCSPAVRTRETLDYFLEVWPLPEGDVRFADALYLAEWDTLLSEVQSLPEPAEIVLMVGHNPGLSDLAQKLIKSKKKEVGTLRTCSFLQMDFAVDTWREVDSRSGKIKLRLCPKDLEG